MTDYTLESSVADPGLYLNCHSVQTPAHPPLSTLADAAVASSGTYHCYPDWNNCPMYGTIFVGIFRGPLFLGRAVCSVGVYLHLHRGIW